jgi:hypothetical protein
LTERFEPLRDGERLLCRPPLMLLTPKPLREFAYFRFELMSMRRNLPRGET